MRSARISWLMVPAAVVLASCGGGSSTESPNTSTTAGTLIYNPPPRVASVNSTDLTTSFASTSSGQALLALAGTPKCGIDFYYIQYQTVGGKGEQTTASGAIMVPNGSAAGCSGALPILVYTHGTAVTQSYNIANPADPNNPAWSTAGGGSEGPIVAAFFAAQGYIVVASNYAGYDTSPLPYHPYLIGAQQSQDVINGLTAARTALKGGLSGASDSGKLFLTGYSQGGYVAMATYRAMLAANIPVTAVSPMSGPYAMEALFDSVVLGEVPLGSPTYGPFVINAYQNSYGDLYSATTDIYSATYATGIDQQLWPGSYTFSTLVSAGKVPQTALFCNDCGVANPPSPPVSNTHLAPLDALSNAIIGASPLAAIGFGRPYLINDSVRVAYAGDALTNPDHGLHIIPPFNGLAPWNGLADFAVSSATPVYPLRKHLRQNDLRTNWAPANPMLMCGGHDDPEVPYAPDTGVFSQFWAPYLSTVPFGGVPNNLVTVLDVDPDTNTSGIQSTIAGLAATAFATDLAAGATPAKIAADVQAAVIVHFAAHFNLTGATPVPIDPQGVFVAALASVAAQAVVQYYAAGVTSPQVMGQDVLFATLAFTHFPSEQAACTVAAAAFFAPLR